MVVLCDTNVVMNYLTERDDPFRDSSVRIIELCSAGKLTGYLAFHSVSILWYVLKAPKAVKRDYLRQVCQVLTVVGATHEQVLSAIDNEAFRDFEDCLQDECARRIHADYLVTCNVKDFKAAKTRACTPDEFLRLFPI